MTTASLGEPERELLLACARVEIDDASARRAAALLEQPLDWEALVLNARLHSVAPLLHRHLSSLVPAGTVPREAARELLALSHRAAFQNRLFADEHRTVVDALGSHGVPVLVQKGLAVVEPLYGNLSLRPLVDLIYLVPADRLAPAKRVLAELGYRTTPAHPVDRIYRWSCPQLVFEKDAPLETIVIVQSDLVSWPRLHALGPETLWARSECRELAGRRVRMLERGDLLIYLCLQADNHGYFNGVGLGSIDARELLFADWTNNRLVRFVDVHELLRHKGGGLDWGAVAERASSAGVGEAVHTTLTLTAELLGAEVPREVLERLRRPGRRRTRQLVFRSLVASEQAGAARGRRMAGAAWRHRRPRTQIRLARMIGLLELAFPGRRLLELRYRPAGGAALPAIAARHSAVAVWRSLLAAAAIPVHHAAARTTGLRSRVRF